MPLPQLRTPFTASTYPSTVRPVCLPTLPLPPWGFTTLVVAGWGRNALIGGSLTDNLKWASRILRIGGRLQNCSVSCTSGIGYRKSAPACCEIHAPSIKLIMLKIGFMYTNLGLTHHCALWSLPSRVRVTGARVSNTVFTN